LFIAEMYIGLLALPPGSVPCPSAIRFAKFTSLRDPIAHHADSRVLEVVPFND
jgi:hypothetical protein